MKKHTTLKSKFNSAFSLVELLVVIAVIAVIAAIAIPNITGAREAAVSSQGSYNTNAATSILNQAAAAGATGAVTLNLSNVLAGNAFTNAQGVVFRLD